MVTRHPKRVHQQHSEAGREKRIHRVYPQRGVHHVLNVVPHADRTYPLRLDLA